MFSHVPLCGLRGYSGYRPSGVPVCVRILRTVSTMNSASCRHSSSPVRAPTGGNVFHLKSAKLRGE